LEHQVIGLEVKYFAFFDQSDEFSALEFAKSGVLAQLFYDRGLGVLTRHWGLGQRLAADPDEARFSGLIISEIRL
jgi:hypothetical protein